jgi:enamine deaminase RidA (YjgF/YER057c/UK114 family)
MKEIALFQEMNEVWDEWVEEGFEPARACVEAKMARDSILVEMTVIAALK